PYTTLFRSLEQRGMTEADLPELVYLVAEESDEYKNEVVKRTEKDNFKTLNDYLMDNFTPAERSELKSPKYFYEITFSKPGGIPMPLIVRYSYVDGSKEMITYPVEIWRKNDKESKRVIASEKEIIRIEVDPHAKTADVDTSNNKWPKEISDSDFDNFKKKVQ